MQHGTAPHEEQLPFLQGDALVAVLVAIALSTRDALTQHTSMQSMRASMHKAHAAKHLIQLQEAAGSYELLHLHGMVTLPGCLTRGHLV